MDYLFLDMKENDKSTFTSHNKRLAFRRPFGRLQGYGLLGRSGCALAPTQAYTHIFAALRTQKPGKNGFKAFGFAYTGSKNVANLERYAKLDNTIINDIDKINKNK